MRMPPLLAMVGDRKHKGRKFQDHFPMNHQEDNRFVTNSNLSNSVESKMRMPPLLAMVGDRKHEGRKFQDHFHMFANGKWAQLNKKTSNYLFSRKIGKEGGYVVHEQLHTKNHPSRVCSRQK